MGCLKSFIAGAVILFFLIAAVKALTGLPEVQQRLSDAPFIDDGRLHPEYDGRLVVVSGSLTSSVNAYDEILSLTLPTPYATRHVQILVPGKDKDGKECLKWQTISRTQESEWLREEYLYGDLRIGAYSIGTSLSDMLALNSEISIDTFDQGELDALLTHNIYPIEYNGTTYLSEVPESVFGSACYDMRYETYRRVYYTGLNPEKLDRQMCIAGVTSDELLSRDDTLDTRPIFEDAKEKSDVVKSNGWTTILGIAVVGIILLFVGAKFLF